MKWKAIYCMEEIGHFDTFREAFIAIYHAVKTEPPVSWQLLDTAIWIIADSIKANPIYFWDAKDLACEMGILVKGQLNE